MSRLCVVPAKPLVKAKARLGPVFTPGERRSIVLAMLADVVSAARACGDVWVICSDADVEETARRFGALSVRDATPEAGLNASLTAATEAATEAGYDGALVLASDLPCVKPADVAALLGAGSVAIAPSRDGGTNGLWRMPPAVIGTAFGAGSRTAHEKLSADAGITPVIVERTGLALDVDIPADLVAALDEGAGPGTVAIMNSAGFASRAVAAEGYRSPRR